MSEKKPTGLGGSLGGGKDYISKKDIPAANNGDGGEKAAEFDKLKKKLTEFQKKVVKKYPFTNALGILPANSFAMFEEEEGLPKEIVESKPLHLIMLIPEEQYKNINKIKAGVVDLVKESKENIWIHIKTEVDLREYGMDSRSDSLDAISAAYPLYDKGLLGSFRVASIHKTLVLRKFDKYITSYAIFGSLTRGTADKDSDVDTVVIVDDTDVKRMNKVELVERLRGWIHDYVREATALAGVKNILNVQVWLLTDFWQRVKDAEPVAFTFIRDGFPLYDRGTFIPWKRLLQMGKIRPSPEAIDLYMKEGERTSELVKRRLLDCMVDTYWGVVTPTQAMFMLADEMPPVPKTLAQDTKKLFVEKEKLMSLKDWKVLDKAVRLFKDYEYGKLKEFSGTEVDKFLSEGREFAKGIKELRKKLEKRMGEKAATEIYEDVFNVLKSIFGKKKQEDLIKDFEVKLVKKGKIRPMYRNILQELVKAKSKIKSGKLSQKEVDVVKRNSGALIDALVEYAQRADVIKAEKGVMQVLYKGRKGELVLLGKDNFFVENREIKKIVDGGFKASNKEEFEASLKENKGKISTQVPSDVFNTLKSELGEFELVF